MYQMTPTTKERILDVAIDLFSKKGYSGVSIREITGAVGIKESSLYNHFKNKDEILGTILENFRIDFARITPPLQVVDEILSRTTPEQFLLQGLLNFKAHAAQPQIGRVWNIVYVEQYRDPRARTILLDHMIQGTLDWLEQIFARWVEAGLIKPLSPRLLAAEYQYPIFAMVTEFNLLKWEDKDTSEIEQRMIDHLHFFLQAVSV